MPGAKVLVLGAGGAARAAVFGLKARGAEVYILNRTPAPAQKLARQAKAKVIKRSDLKKLSFDVIINATPVGMGDAKASPLNEKEITAKFVHGHGLLRGAKPASSASPAPRGATVIPGWEMFVYQGARQFEIWTGKPAPLSEMQNEVLSALAARARNGKQSRRNGSLGSSAACSIALERLGTQHSLNKLTPSQFPIWPSASGPPRCRRWKAWRYTSSYFAGDHLGAARRLHSASAR